MASQSRPDLEPQSSSEWRGWHRRYQAQQVVTQLKHDPRLLALVVERKKQRDGYGSL